jgi:hypothetical protein
MADSTNEQLALVTLAAGIIAGRRATTVQEFEKALADAKHILTPEAVAAEHQAWRTAHGLTPTAPEEGAGE